jgi:hypothetical protein
MANTWSLKTEIARERPTYLFLSSFIKALFLTVLVDYGTPTRELTKRWVRPVLASTIAMISSLTVSAYMYV